MRHKNQLNSQTDVDSELTRLKREVAVQLRKEMQRRRASQSALARRSGVSRSALGRLVNQQDSSTTLRFLGYVADGLGASISLRLVRRPLAKS